MGSSIRPASAADAPEWLDLLRAVLGDGYPAKEVYDLNWIASQLNPASGAETWVAEMDGRLQGTISFLNPDGANPNPVANLRRNLIRPESVENGAAENLVRSVDRLASQRGEMPVVRVSSLDNAQQILFENLGYACVGCQPLSDSLPQVSELAISALERLQIPHVLVVRDGATGYPLQCDLKVHDGTGDDFELWRKQAESANPPMEISGRFNHG